LEASYTGVPVTRRERYTSASATMSADPIVREFHDFYRTFSPSCNGR
jgi:DNA/RNA-binding domain of Phe-tRNA-synthetase-like protein